MFVYCAYFSDLDVALYVCKLSFCTFSLAKVKVSGHMGAILFSVLISANQNWPLTFSRPFLAWANQRACFLWEQPSLMLTFHHFILGLCREQKW